MLFPVEEAASDLQLRLCVGDSVDSARPPHGSDSDEPKELSLLHRPPESLCLRRRRLQRVSEDLLKNRAIKYLYLEDNELQSVPPSLFTSLPNLLWLDLRHNQIRSLPTEIGRHRCLRTLLLEGNPIEELPLELGNVLSLSGLNLRDCPLRFPPSGVLQRGVQSVLQFLRATLAQRPVSAPKRPPDTPVVERLQLDLMESSVDEDEEQEEELERFRELKLQMDIMEKAEQRAAAKAARPRLLPSLKRKKATRTSVAPLQLSAPPWNSPEERRQAALRELREKEAILEQRRKNQEELHNWWTRAKNPQLAGHRGKKPGRQRHAEEEETEAKLASENSSDVAPHQAHSSVDYEESRAVKKLQQKMYAVVQRMEERRRNPAASSQELFGPADRDVKEIRRLQAQLLDVKRGRGFALYSAHARQKRT